MQGLHRFFGPLKKTRSYGTLYPYQSEKEQSGHLDAHATLAQLHPSKGGVRTVTAFYMNDPHVVNRFLHTLIHSGGWGVGLIGFIGFVALSL